MSTVVLRTTNARGVLCGESQPACRYSDAVVRDARAMRQAGATLAEISSALGGPHFTTVSRWCSGQRRRPPARVVVKVIRPLSQARTQTKGAEHDR